MISGSMTDDWIETMKSFDHRSSDHRFDCYDNLLFNYLPRRPPGEPIGRTSQLDHQRPVLTRHAGRPSDDDHFIADLERFSSHALIGQLSAAAPLDGPPLLDAVFVGSLEVHEGMRVAVDELHQLSFELDLLVDVVGGAVGMVRVGGGAGHQCEQDKSACGFTHHFFS